MSNEIEDGYWWVCPEREGEPCIAWRAFGRWFATRQCASVLSVRVSPVEYLGVEPADNIEGLIHKAWGEAKGGEYNKDTFKSLLGEAQRILSKLSKL